MRHIIGILLFFLSLNIWGDETIELSDLGQLEWKHRILVLWSESPKTDYKVILDSHKKEIDDRDMIIFVLDEVELRTNYESQISSNILKKIKLRFPKNEGNYFLIGKDGGIKKTGNSLDLGSIFGEIDLMPMRQYEIQNRK